MLMARPEIFALIQTEKPTDRPTDTDKSKQEADGGYLAQANGDAGGACTVDLPLIARTLHD